VRERLADGRLNAPTQIELGSARALWMDAGVDVRSNQFVGTRLDEALDLEHMIEHLEW
jgi:hypothetical protein